MALFVQPPEQCEEIKSSEQIGFPFLEKSITMVFFCGGGDGEKEGGYYIKIAIVYRCYKSTSR